MIDLKKKKNRNIQIQKLQKVQNKALRIVYNTKWEEFITNQTLHNRANIEYLKDRLLNLQEKAIGKLKMNRINT